jgi:type IV pilus assembly protein PilY1
MGHKGSFKTTLYSIVLLLFAGSGVSVNAGTNTIPIADGPLTVSSSAEGADPNVMLLMDDSGSMNNMVWSDGYINAITQPADDPNWTRPTFNNWDPGTGSNQWADQPNEKSIDVSNQSGDSVVFTGVMVDANNNTITRTLTLPTPVGSDTRYYREYLNYLFDTYANTNNTDLTGIIPAETRMMQAKAAAIALVENPSNADKRFGLFSFQGTKLKHECGSGTTHIQSLSNSISDLNPSRYTPLAETYYDIVEYFKSDTSSPIQYRCQKNFVVVVTDGYPTRDNTFTNSVDETIWLKDANGDFIRDASGNPTSENRIGNLLPDWDGEAPATTLDDFLMNTLDPKSDGYFPNGGSEDDEGYTLYLDDLAKYGYDIDLRTGNDDSGNSYDGSEYPQQNLMTFTIGFTTDNKMLKQAAEYGHGNYYVAKNGTQLTAALDDALASVESSSSLHAVTPVTLSSGYLSSDTKLFFADYTAGEWTSSIEGYRLHTNEFTATGALNPNFGTIDTTSKFSLTIPSARNIYTIKSTAGITLQWTNLDSAQQTALCGTDCTATDTSVGQDRLDYIKGDQTKEESTGGTFRNRTSLLGDIMSSAMTYIQKSLFRYTENDYVTYKEGTASRKPMLYVGANDGMLHAFDVSDGIYEELFAYVPNEVFSNLKELTNPAYDHKYYVDGTPTVGDAYYNNDWHTVLVGGLNKGGQGIYALDVSEPTTFGTANVLWEFTDSDDADLGYTYSRPAIVKMANNKWAAVFGNGYNNTEQDASTSTTGDAALYIAFIEDGIDGWSASDFVKIPVPLPAGETSDIANGLATVAPVDLDGDFIIDRIYAGDVVGNLWRFDVTSTTPNDWKNSTNTTRLFIACRTTPAATGCPTADRQAITTRPEVGRGPTSNSVLVYFGTGKFLTNDDPNDKSLQTFYAVKDDGTTNLNRTHLQSQTITDEFTSSTTTQSGDSLPYRVRVTSSNTVDYSSQKGWRMDLIYNNTDTGERVIYEPILRNGRIIFVTNYYTSTTTNPNTGTAAGASPDLCTASGVTMSGKGWLMELDAMMGRRLAYTPFDVNDDRLFDSGDYVDIGDATNPDWVPVSGRQFEGNIASPSIATHNNFEFKYNTQSTGNIQVTTENPGPSFGRQSWRQLK